MKRETHWCVKCANYESHKKREVVLAAVTMPNGERYGAAMDV